MKEMMEKMMRHNGQEIKQLDLFKGQNLSDWIHNQKIQRMNKCNTKNKMKLKIKTCKSINKKMN